MARRKRKPGRVRPHTRPLHLEVLEDRRLLANVTVGNLNDVVDGTTTSIAALIATPGADGISLREAVLAANADVAADVIDFSVAGTIQLTNVGHVGEIAITRDVSINGPGAGLLTVRAFDPSATLGDGARIFNVFNPFFGTSTVAISGLTLTGGDSGGGAIRNLENLTITNSTISGNNGGGIGNSDGNLTIIASTISGNASTGSGGGINSNLGTLTISQSTISGNSGGSLIGGGGGIHSSSSTTTIDSSTISGNSANYGGGIYSSVAGITITNSTISGNSARSIGGGVWVASGSLTMRHSTITLNRSDSDNSGGENGGGLSAGGAILEHTIVAGNLRSVSTRDDINGTLTAGSAYNLIGVDTGFTGISNGTNGNQIGTTAAPIDPMLGVLADYGGPTLTHALLVGSPAIDLGNSAFAPPPANDQRGAPFARVVDGDGAGGARIDIGAYERQALPAEFFVVDTLADENDGSYSVGDRSLREAIVLANSVSLGADTITFAASLTSGGPATILLLPALDELTISDSLTITGPGASLLTIDANDPTPSTDNGDGNRVFTVSDGNAAVLIDVEIVGLKITRADPDVGAAIVTAENLTVVDSIITGNASIGINGSANPNSLTVRDSTISFNSGGGVYKRNGSLEIERCTIAYNSASRGGGVHVRYVADVDIRDSTIDSNTALNSGGGIYLRGGSATITGSTISNNFVSDPGVNASGGGVTTILATSLTVRHSTITGNRLSSGGSGGGFGGGGLFVFPGVGSQASLDHTIVAGNQSYSFPGPDVSGSADASYSLIGDDTDATITDNGGNQIGTSASPIDPLLGPLADNGGPTMTHALLLGSPAIDAGDPDFVGPPDYDQRGFAYNRVVGGLIDVGSFEFGASSADFDQDGDIDGLDFLAWQIGFGTLAPNAVKADGDSDNDTDVDGADLAVWEGQYGTEEEELSVLHGGSSTVGSQLSATDQSSERAVAPIQQENSDGTARFGASLSARLVDLAMAGDGTDETDETYVGLSQVEFAPQELRAHVVIELGAAPRLVADFGDIAVSRPSDEDSSAVEVSLDEELVFGML